MVSEVEPLSCQKVLVFVKNMKKQQKNQTIFSEELFSCRRSAEGGLARRPVGVVLSTKPLKLVPACIKQGSPRGENKRIASHFPPNYSLLLGKPALLRNLFLRNEPNSNNANFTANPYSRDIYNDLQPKPKNGTNPNEPNQSQFQSLRSLWQKNRRYLVKNKKMKSKPNLCAQRLPQFRIGNPFDHASGGASVVFPELWASGTAFSRTLNISNTVTTP